MGGCESVESETDYDETTRVQYELSRAVTTLDTVSALNGARRLGSEQNMGSRDIFGGLALRPYLQKATVVEHSQWKDGQFGAKGGGGQTLNYK